MANNIPGTFTPSALITNPNFTSDAGRYIGRIRNERKARYAWAYMYWLQHNWEMHCAGIGEPDPKTFGLSSMGAQAVRLALSDIAQPTRPI